MSPLSAPVPRTDDLDDERERIERAQAGDLDAMRPVLERYAQPLYQTVLLPRLGNAALAEEVLRDALSTAVVKLDRFTWQGRSIYPWLRQIALHKLMDRFRDGARRRRLADALAAEVGHDDAAPSADAEVLAAAERAEHRARIDATLDTLHERYRAAIELRLVAEKSREECAHELGVTVGTFDVLLFRAIRAFRKAYGEP